MTVYESAKARYAALGVDTEAALSRLASIPISLHCWQGDDVVGFEPHAGALSGGIQTTGDYPGRARTPEELMADLDEVLAMLPGKHRLNLHASYAVFAPGEAVDRDRLTPAHFQPWIDFAKARGLGLDFNPTCFSHPMVKDGLTLSSPDETVRRFWIDHCKACRAIASEFARQLGTESVVNIWIPDGLKDEPADRLGPRARFASALDEIYAVPAPGVVDCLESKVFGIGVESYTVGSNEFCLGYCGTHKHVFPLLDNGHYHPTESVADKIPALLLFFDRLVLHVTRGVRWDSDHVVLLTDETRAIAQELVRCDALGRVPVALDFFDASINRVGAWVTGARAMRKALLEALLTPHESLRQMQNESRFTERMMTTEALKTLPFGAVWDEFCARESAPDDLALYPRVAAYEQKILPERAE